MTKKNIKFSVSETIFYFDGNLTDTFDLAAERSVVVITDENVYEAHKKKFTKVDTIVMPAGEDYKVQATVDMIIEQLIEFKADRSTLLVGVGGGVVTDITGYVASVFMRGLSFGFVPTSLLAMVDAAIGGKNGIDVGVYKNMVGTIRQPEFLLYDYKLLKTLPDEEWSNGMAEVIKHAVIKDSGMFKLLSAKSLPFLKRNKAFQHKIIMRNVLLKAKVVQADEFEKNERKLLNFGHTIGHAIENMLAIPHGHAVSVGMVYAAHLSNQMVKFKYSDRLIQLLEQYELPTHAAIDTQTVLENIGKDKKRFGEDIHFVLLQRIGKAFIQPIPMTELAAHLENAN